MVLVYHLLTGFSHSNLPLLDDSYLLLYLGSLGVEFILILILLDQLLPLPLLYLVNTLDELMLLEIPAFEERMMEDVGFRIGTHLIEVVEIELAQKGGVFLMTEVTREEGGAEKKRPVNYKGAGVVHPADEVLVFAIFQHFVKLCDEGRCASVAPSLWSLHYGQDQKYKIQSNGNIILQAVEALMPVLSVIDWWGSQFIVMHFGQIGNAMGWDWKGQRRSLQSLRRFAA